MAHIVQAITVRWYNACADYTITLSRGLRAIGHRVTVTAGPRTPAVAKAGEHGLDVFAPGDPATGNPLGFLRLAAAYRAYALKNDVRAVNVHHGRDHLVWAVALRGTGIPIVRTSGDQIPPRTHPLARYLFRFHTAGVIASCMTVRSFFAEGFGIDPSRIPVVNGGVDDVRFAPDHRRRTLREEFGIPEDAFVFGMIGRFSPVKGHRFFFEAAAETARAFPRAWFAVAGWDAQLSERDIRGMAERAGILERTRFPGRRNDVRDLIGALDAGVIASVGSEAVCRIALEYMAMGVPVIAADTNVIPELVPDGLAGIVYRAGDSGTLAGAMKRMAGSPGQAGEWGRNGRVVVEREFSLERFAEKTIDAFGSMSVHV